MFIKDLSNVGRTRQRFTIIRGLVIFSFCLSVMGVNPPFTPDIESHPTSTLLLSQNPIYSVGFRDSHENITYTLKTPAFGVTLNEEYTFQSYPTDGHQICMYGNFVIEEEGLRVEFFFTDNTGFDEFTDTVETSP